MEISKVDVKYLKEKYGTPLYIYDVAHLKRNMEGYLKYFKSNEFETEVLFASKAFSVKEALRIAKEEGMSLDVVSLGELYTALKVDFPKDRIYFHGNNKTMEELEYAISYGIGMIVVDNLMELYAIDELTKKLSKGVNILIRMNVGVEAHTHKFIVTSHVDSKFGVLYNSEDYKEMLEVIKKNSLIKFKSISSSFASCKSFSNILATS